MGCVQQSLPHALADSSVGVNCGRPSISCMRGDNRTSLSLLTPVVNNQVPLVGIDNVASEPAGFNLGGVNSNDSDILGVLLQCQLQGRSHLCLQPRV